MVEITVWLLVGFALGVGLGWWIWVRSPSAKRAKVMQERHDKAIAYHDKFQKHVRKNLGIDFEE